MAKQPRFNDLFEEWARDYDRAVTGGHPEYIEVFQGYHEILKTVVETLSLPRGSVVLEFGVGTGNLSRLLLDAGYRVIGIEPSAAMRERAKSKLPELELYEGHFLQVPEASRLWTGSSAPTPFTTSPMKRRIRRSGISHCGSVQGEKSCSPTPRFRMKGPKGIWNGKRKSGVFMN